MPTYRKDIDGLRGLAVLVVVFFHFNFLGFQGGFIGVDVFFVISGYLIGSIILSDLEKNEFSFAAFYQRRICRILPALYTVILAILVFSVLFMDDEFREDFSGSALSSVYFFSNFFFHENTAGYFVRESGSQALLHTWSLSIEEQFYLVFPLLIFLLYRKARKYFLHFIIAISVLSLISSIIFTKSHPSFSFYLPLTRSWEFLAGFLTIYI